MYLFVLLAKNRPLFSALRASPVRCGEQSKKRWDNEMKERGLSKDEAFMVETAAAAEIVSEHKNKKEKHKAAFGTSSENLHSRVSDCFLRPRSVWF